jgi:hypothetical protein
MASSTAVSFKVESPVGSQSYNYYRSRMTICKNLIEHDQCHAPELKPKPSPRGWQCLM